MMKRLFLFLAILIASVGGAHAQGSWSGLQSLSFPSMTNGHMYWNYLLLGNYSSSGTKAPILVYEHENDEGDKCYPTNTAACATNILPLASGGTGVNDWFNTAAFQARYCSNASVPTQNVGCIIISPYADQTSDPSGATSNFGGYGDTPGSQPNENAVVAIIQYAIANLNGDPNRVYAAGDSLGGIGTQALALDYGINTGSLGHIVAGVLPFSGAIYRGGLTAPTNAQLAQIQGGPFQFDINGSGDTGTSSNPALWMEPLWTDIVGSGGTPPAQAAAVGFNTQTFGSNVVVGNTASPTTSYPLFTGTNNWVPCAFYTQGWKSIGYTTNSDNSVTITGSGSAFGANLCTASPGNAAFTQNPLTFTGQTFGGGGYFEATMKGSIGGPMSFWMVDVETANGTGLGVGPNPWPGQAKFYGDWIERDIAEFDSPNVFGGALHNDYGIIGSGSTDVNGYIGSDFTPSGPPNYEAYHKYGLLWVPATATTSGYTATFFDGVEVGVRYYWSKYNPALGPPPVNGGNNTPNTPTTPGTAGSVWDTLHMLMLLGADPALANSTTISSVNVWQANGLSDLPVINASSTAYPGPPAGGRAGSSPVYFLLDTTLGHDVWDTYRPLPAGQPFLDLLFAQVASGTSGEGNTCTTACSPLPSGYLTTSGNQVQSGGGTNVRLACTGYDKPTGNVSADMNGMRMQGFNCARVPWFDKVLCPSGSCNFTATDAIVAAATSNNMRVIFDHASNEGVDGTSGCTNQQANGLWYDLNAGAPWNITNNTDGCGTAGTVSYAQFKANSVALATHYAANSTVIGFDLHNEPTTFGNPACCASGGGGGGGTGQFKIVNGQIIDPQGNLYVASGINLDLNEATIAVTNSLAQPMTTLFPKINHVRLVVHLSTPFTGYPPPASMATFINQMTANHIVVDIDDHSCNGGALETSSGAQNPPPYCVPPTSGAALTTVTNWYTALAQYYGNNPYVWFASVNEPCAEATTCNYSSEAVLGTYQKAIYNAVRVAGGANNMMQMLQGIGGGNCQTVGTNSSLNPADYAAMTNIVWELHSYYTNGTQAGAASQLQGSVSAACGYVAAQSIQSADGLVPVIFGEWGSADGDPNNGDASAMAAAMQALILANPGIGQTGWAWYPSTQWQMVNNGDTAGGPFSLTTWGQQSATLIQATASTGGATVSGAGAGWGTANGADMKAMVEDTGAAVEAADPGALIIVEGIFNNGTLFNGTTRGSTALPITAGSIGDLSTVGTLPVACCSGHVLYSIHDMPTSISSVAPDSGAAATTMRTTAWGYLEKNGTAPVWVGKLGADLDNSNGQLSDENAWATGLTQYMNGQLGGQGGPTFSSCAQPMGGDWWDYGYNPSYSPNGTLIANGLNNSGQQPFWLTLLYTPCSNGGGGGGSATTWNPNDKSAGITLSNSNQTATSTAAGSNSVRSTTSQTAGRVCADIGGTALTSNWDVGITNSTYSLTVGGGLGVDTNGIGFDPNSAGGLQGVFYNNAVLSSGAVSSANGDTATICADIGAKLLWVSTTAMRGASHPWNNAALTAQNPATGTGGISFSGITCPCFLTFNEGDTGGIAVLNPTGPFQVSTPSGFLPWQPAANTTASHSFVVIMGN